MTASANAKKIKGKGILSSIIYAELQINKYHLVQISLEHYMICLVVVSVHGLGPAPPLTCLSPNPGKYELLQLFQEMESFVGLLLHSRIFIPLVPFSPDDLDDGDDDYGVNVIPLL